MLMSHASSFCCQLPAEKQMPRAVQPMFEAVERPGRSVHRILAIRSAHLGIRSAYRGIGSAGHETDYRGNLLCSPGPLRRLPSQLQRFPVNLLQGPLDVINFILRKKRFAALCADPSGNGLPSNMIAMPVCAERGGSSDHPAFAIIAFHYCLALKSADHCSGDGRYAVITARYSSFGAQTTCRARPIRTRSSRQLSPR